MKIGIMSDSHDHIEHIKKSVRIFKERGAAYVLHLGDYISPNAVRACRGIKLVGIFGNNDGDEFRIVTAFQNIEGEIKGDFHEFEEGNLKIACYHGAELQIKDALVESGRYHVVVYGHTHKPENKIVRKTLVLNPGTVHGFGGEATIMIFDTETKEAEFIDL